MVKKPERSSYTSVDFREWSSAGSLEISPKFQRRGVWNRSARSSLIDTLLLGLPVPPIYMRMVQGKNKEKMVREIVDGQQRLSAILDFMNNKFSLGPKIESVSARGKYFSQLSADQKSEIEQYSFICEVMYGVADQDVLRIFARLNTYSVSLNQQELRNGKYFGDFKLSAYALALEHLEFWRKNKIYTERGIARMNEVELTSELMIAIMAGMLDKKGSINEYYENFDDEFDERAKVEREFKSVIDALSEIFEGEISSMEFRRAPLFYSLFCAIFHRMYGLPNEQLPTPKKVKISRADEQSLYDAAYTLSNVIEEAKSDEEKPSANRKKFENFIVACSSQTDNLATKADPLSDYLSNSF